MKTKYPINKFTIKYDYETKLFNMWDKDGELVGTDTSGRELGRDAWEDGAEEVEYRYDLGIDENIPLIPRHEKYKTRS
jgi:hypothetical protein